MPEVQVLLNCFGLFFTTGCNFGSERDKCLLDEEVLDRVAVIAGRVRDGSTNRRWDQIEEQCRLAKRQGAVELLLNNEESSMKNVAQTVANGRGVDAIKLSSSIQGKYL